MTRESTRRHLLGAMAALGTGSAVVGKAAAGDGPVGTAALAERASELQRRIERDVVERNRQGASLAAGQTDPLPESVEKRLDDGGFGFDDSPFTNADEGGSGDDSDGGSGTGTATFDRGGIIVGYYGRPWSHGERLDSLQWMADRGLDTFVFAPKNDPYQRANWRGPYPDEQFENFTEEITLARDVGVDWIPNISPGLPLIPGTPARGETPSRDICFSCREDRQVLYDKLDRFFEAGVRTMMVSFDDTPKRTSHPEDNAEYGPTDEDYGRMNRDLLNATYERYAAKAEEADDGSSFTLLTVLADYDGTDDTEYLQGVRSEGGLRDGIQVLWTGTAVVSRAIASEDAREYAGHVGKDRVMVWDNYPVNDYAGGAEGRSIRLFLGPYRGRAPDLPKTVSGIVANPMSQPRASRIALGALARYLEDPAGYDHEAAWRASVETEGGPAAVTDALAALAENSRASTLDREESPVFVERRDAFLTAYDEGAFWPASAARFRAELDRERDAPAVLHEHRPNLTAEAAPFLDQLRANADAARAGVDLLAAQRPFLSASAERSGGSVTIRGSVRPPSPETVGERLSSFATAYADTLDDRMVHGDRVGHDFSTVYANENRVDAFARDVAERTATWAPTAGRATSDVTVTVAGEEVTVGDGGRFETTVGADAVEVVATDGAGGQTGRTVSPDRE